MQAVRAQLGLLNPHNMLMTVVAKPPTSAWTPFPSDDSVAISQATEPHYGFSYSTAPFSAVQMTLWGARSDAPQESLNGWRTYAVNLPLNAALSSPAPNTFIPTDFRIKAAVGERHTGLLQAEDSPSAAAAAAAATTEASQDPEDDGPQPVITPPVQTSMPELGPLAASGDGATNVEPLLAATTTAAPAWGPPRVLPPHPFDVPACKNPQTAADVTETGVTGSNLSFPVQFPEPQAVPGRCALWHRMDDTFLLPKATLNVSLTPPPRQWFAGSARMRTLCGLLVSVLEDVLQVRW
jgi:hypothetical protein